MSMLHTDSRYRIHSQLKQIRTQPAIGESAGWLTASAQVRIYTSANRDRCLKSIVVGASGGRHSVLGELSMSRARNLYTDMTTVLFIKR